MRRERHTIGELEELVLLVIGILGDNAYGISVKNEVEKHTGRSLTISAVHAVLLRLEKKKLVTSQMGGGTSARGGRRKRLFQLTGMGKDAISEAKEIRLKLWDLMPDTP